MPTLQRALFRALKHVAPRPLVWAVAVAAGLAGSGRLDAQQPAYVRFDITSVGDSTFTFVTTGAGWVKRSRTGLVVDPLHDDELIAKFRVTRTQKGAAMGVVTAQTARLSTTDVALLTQPRPFFLTRPWFWVTLVVGGAVGYFAHGH